MVRTPPSQSSELRLLTIMEVIGDWIARLGLSVVSIERIFVQDNLRSVIGVAQAMGIVMAMAVRVSLEVAQHTPSETKAAVMGSGTADKAQVQAMVTRILGLDVPPQPADAVDALAQAVCHGRRGGGMGMGGAIETASAGGAVRVLTCTPVQRQRVAAQVAARRTGAVDPRRIRR